jgi:uncharacterized membrane protein
MIPLTSFARHTSASPPPLKFQADAPPEHEERSWAERLLWTLVGIAIINWSIALLSPASDFEPVALLMVFAGFYGLCVCVFSWLPVKQNGFVDRYSVALAWFTAILLVALLGAWAFVQLHNQPNYGTDELTFDQYAAVLARQGHNPYTHSMGPAPPLYRLAADLFSYTLKGKPVEQLSYPSLSFLVYVPFMLLGWQNQVGAGVNVIAWAIAILLMFKLLPRNIRAVALVIGSVDAYTSFAAGGVTDMLYIPLLIVAAYRWDRFGQRRRTYIGPIALGLAMAVKQTPWPVLVFVLIAIAYDEYDRTGLREALERAGRYTAAVVIAFLVPNIPYIVVAPSAWFHGVITPFTQNLVPSGQGLVALTLFAHAGGGSLAAFTVATALVFVLMVALFAGTYPLLRPATFLLPTFAYFFAARSQTNYLIPLIPVALVGAITAGPAVTPALLAGRARRRIAGWPAAGLRIAERLEELCGRVAAAVGTMGPLRSATWGGVISLFLVGSLAATAYSLVAPAPLKIRISKIMTTGFVNTIDRLTLNVRNSSGSSVKPVFTLQTVHGDTTFWNVISGPRSLAPHSGATYVIGAPNAQSEPNIADGFSVLGFVDKPASVSVSGRFLPDLWSAEFIPQAFDEPIPVGRRVRVKVQIVDHFNDPVSRAGIPVYMTQQVYGSLGVRHPGAVINDSPPNKPAVALTNSNGVATFYIVGKRSRSIPVTFGAHLKNARAQYVYGGAGYLNVRFTK